MFSSREAQDMVLRVHLLKTPVLGLSNLFERPHSDLIKLVGLAWHLGRRV